MCKRESREYRTNRDRYKRQPDDINSIIVDETDQSANRWPHFVTDTNSVRERSLKVKFVGFIEHGTQKKSILPLQKNMQQEKTKLFNLSIFITYCAYVRVQFKNSSLCKLLTVAVRKNSSLFSYLESWCHGKYSMKYILVSFMWDMPMRRLTNAFSEHLPNCTTMMR